MRKNAKNKIVDTTNLSAKDSTTLDSLQMDSLNKAKIDTTLLLSPKELDSNYKPLLDTSIDFSATDSAVFVIATKNVFLHKDAQAKYQDMDIKGEVLQFDQAKRNITLYPAYDTALAGVRLKDKTRFKQGGSEYLSDTVIFNLTTKKGLVKNSFTTQGELYIWTETSKKVDDDNTFIADVRFTTCALDHPHFAFTSGKGKFKRGKVGVTRTIYPEFEGVVFNIPVSPFAIFPLTSGTKNGLIVPQFLQTADRGYGLINGGYYFKIGDYINSTVQADVYTYGSLGIRLTSDYLKRYKFSGNTNLSFLNLKTGIPGDSARANNYVYSISFQHSVDPKSMPNASLSFNVNLQSSLYNSTLLNNPTQNFQNQINSSAAYSQRWKKAPIVLSLSGSHSANTSTKIQNINFPTLNLSLQNLTPLANIGTGNAWYKKTSIKYDMTASSQTFFYDTATGIMKVLVDNFKWGVQHRPSISLTLPALGPLLFTPGISYSEVWTDRKTTIKYLNAEKRYDTSIEKSLYRYYDLNFNFSVSTNIYGTWLFGRGSPLRGVRHTLRPQVSLSYKPNVNSQNYYTITDANNVSIRKNYYEGAMYGTYSETEFAGLNFNLSTSLEIKVRNRKDTITGTKNVSIIDNLSISGNYNLSKDTNNIRPLSNISINLTTKVANKISITASGTLDPYGFDTLGNQTLKYRWQDGKGFSIGRLTNFSVATSFNLVSGGNSSSNGNSSNADKKKILTTLTPLEKKYQNWLFHDSSAASSYRNYFHNWSLSVSYALSYKSTFFTDIKDYKYELASHSINISGTIATTALWQVGYGANITLGDLTLSMFNNLKFNTLNFTVTRDLHCWVINMSIVPIGLVRSISFVIQPKSGLLRDVKVEKSRYYRD